VSLQELQQAVIRLNSDEFEAFSVWFEEFRNQRWDEQFEADAPHGRLEARAARALESRRKP
jgi:hypothetical protein